MEVVILRTDGTPVRLNHKFTQPKFDSEGFLVGFTYANEVYKIIQNDDFGYSGKDIDLGGYYKEVVVRQYIANMYNPAMTPLEIKTIESFPFAGLEAQSGDTITVTVVDFSIPYNYFYKENKYTFKIELVDNIVKKYKKPVFDNFHLVGFQIDLPSSSLPPTPNDVNLMEQPTGYFFRKNFGEFVGNWSGIVSNGGKSTYKKIATLTAYKINYIVEDVIRHIIPASSFEKIYEKVSSGTIENPDPIGLSPLEDLVFTLLWNWGYFYRPTDDPIYIYSSVLNPIMSGQPDFYEYSRYFNGVSQFYFTAYRERDKLKKLSDYKKIEYLLSILPLAALRIIPYPTIKATLLNYIIARKANEKEEQFIVRLILSVSKAKADDFLDFLLKRANGIETGFDVLYNLLDDARLERYPIVSWFVDEQTNRKYFVYAIYELWKVSKYNWNYFPPGVTHNSEDIYDKSYFIVNEKEYNGNNVLEFYVPLTDTVTTRLIELRGATKYFAKINDTLINITGRTNIVLLSKTGIKAHDEFKTENLNLGNFHLYHPLTLIGYQPNFELEIPQTSVVPAFLYYYAKEYDKLVDFDAGTALAINVGIDIALFFALGGGGILNSLKYLKQITQLGQAIRGVLLPPTKSVTIWKASETIGEAVTLTASTIANFQGYLAAKAPDNATKEHHLAIQRWMIGLMLFSIGGTVYARIRAVREADRILTMMSRFPNGSHGVPGDIEALLTTLRGKKAVLAANLETTLNKINVNGIIDNVVAKFKKLDDRQKYLLFEDFGNLTEEGWKSLNKNANAQIDNWLLLRNNNIVEAGNLNVISNPQLVNGFLRYYAETDVRIILGGLDETKRLELIGEVGNNIGLFNIFKNDTDLLQSWIRYRFEPNLTKEFKALSETDALSLVRRYGNCSDLGFRMIRSYPKASIERLLKYPEATHHIDYFNTRRAEMLPDNFRDGKTKNMIRLHEVDNYIELELKLNKRLRASLKSEAGDLIDDITDLSYDTMGIPHDVIRSWTSNGLESVNYYFEKFLESIDGHFDKINKIPPLDYVAIDYKYFDEISSAINQPPNYLKNQIDQHIIQNHNGQINKLIKLNY